MNAGLLMNLEELKARMAAQHAELDAMRARAEQAEAKLSVCEDERDKARAIIAASPTAFLLYEKWFGLPAAVNELPGPDRLLKMVQP